MKLYSHTQKKSTILNITHLHLNISQNMRFLSYSYLLSKITTLDILGKHAKNDAIWMGGLQSMNAKLSSTENSHTHQDMLHSLMNNV